MSQPISPPPRMRLGGLARMEANMPIDSYTPTLRVPDGPARSASTNPPTLLPNGPGDLTHGSNYATTLSHTLLTTN
jgi:hypothetical protein